MIRLPQKIPEPSVRVMTPDGRLTREWYQYLREIDVAVRSLVETVNDHEIRITTLEP